MHFGGRRSRLGVKVGEVREQAAPRELEAVIAAEAQWQAWVALAGGGSTRRLCATPKGSWRH